MTSVLAATYNNFEKKLVAEASKSQWAAEDLKLFDAQQQQDTFSMMVADNGLTLNEASTTNGSTFDEDDDGGAISLEELSEEDQKAYVTEEGEGRNRAGYLERGSREDA